VSHRTVVERRYGTTHLARTAPDHRGTGRALPEHQGSGGTQPLGGLGHFLWLLARGLTAKVIASITGYSAYWIGRITWRYNQHGPNGVNDRRHQSRPSTPLLSASQQDELVAALAAGGAPEGERWSGRTVAAWISQRLGRRVGRQLGWAYLRRLGARLRVPRPRHVRADPQAQAAFKQRLRPLLRAVATAFPHATVELWAVDEHRIGLKPILGKVWTLPGQRPIAPVEHRYAWRYVVGFVHPASGRTVWHLATTVNVELFSVELEAFARQVGAAPTKQIVVVLDGAGWHDSPKVRVPEHVHLLFLPPHSPELQPAEHLWALVATDEHHVGQPALRQHRGAGGRPGGALRRAAGAAGPRPLSDPLPLVAPTHQEATRSSPGLTGS
jgi:transposase